MDVGVNRAVEADLCRAALRVVEEVQAVAANGQVRNQFAVKHVLRFGTVDNLAHSQTIVVILEMDGRAALGHLLQLAARLPLISPRSIGQRIANRVVGDALAL